MKITFPNKEQAKEALENVMRFATKYTWDKKCIPIKVIKEAKKLMKTGRVSSEGIKYGLYDPRKQTLYERTEEILVQIMK